MKDLTTVLKEMKETLLGQIDYSREKSEISIAKRINNIINKIEQIRDCLKEE
jgi:hypothetical protein